MDISQIETDVCNYLSYTEHRDTEESIDSIKDSTPNPNTKPNPAYRGSVNVVSKVWIWISLSEEAL